MSVTRPMRSSRRAFSLIEAVVVVVVLSISVPTTLVFTDAAVSRRADSVTAIRATAYATAVMESVMADSSSRAAGRGFEAFANTASYLEGPQGLFERLAGVTAGYRAQGMSCAVGIGPKVDATGEETGVAELDLFRKVDVKVTFPLVDGGASELVISGMVTQW